MIKLLLPPRNNIRVDGKSVYTLYLQLKNHFNGRGDVIKSKWRMKVSDASYAKRRDRMFFERLSEKFTLKELCLIFIGNLVSNPNTWVGEMSDSGALDFYKLYLTRLRLVRSRYEDDIKSIHYFSKKMNISLKQIMCYNESTQSSYIFKLLQGGMISFETFIMLDSFLNIIDEHDKYDNIVWSSYSSRLRAYRKLFIVEPAEARQTFVELMRSLKD